MYEEEPCSECAAGVPPPVERQCRVVGQSNNVDVDRNKAAFVGARLDNVVKYDTSAMTADCLILLAAPELVSKLVPSGFRGRK